MDDSFDLIGSKLDSQRISNKMTSKTALGTVTSSSPSVVTNVTLSKGQSVNQTSSTATSLSMASATMTPMPAMSFLYQYFVMVSYFMGPCL